MWRCLRVPKNFPVILPENDCGNGDGGGVEVPVESLKEWRECSIENEKEEKERKEKWGSEPAKGMKR